MSKILVYFGYRWIFPDLWYCSLWHATWILGVSEYCFYLHCRVQCNERKHAPLESICICLDYHLHLFRLGDIDILCTCLDKGMWVACLFWTNHQGIKVEIYLTRMLSWSRTQFQSILLSGCLWQFSGGAILLMRVQEMKKDVLPNGGAMVEHWSWCDFESACAAIKAHKFVRLCFVLFCFCPEP